jgi:hypothetical protein
MNMKGYRLCFWLFCLLLLPAMVLGAVESSNIDLMGTIGTDLDLNDLSVQGDYAYISRYRALTIIDVSNPSNPREAGSLSTQYGIRYFTVSGNYAYVLSYSSGFRVIDISAPDSPHETGSCSLPSYPTGLCISGSYAYVITNSSGLRVIDISAPNAPAETGYCDLPVYPRRISVSDSKAYVVTSSSGFRVIDVSFSTSPVELGYYGSDSVEDTCISGNYAYTLEGSNLNVVDISVSSSPKLTSSCYVGYPDTVHLRGNYAYLHFSSSLKIVDISSPHTPNPLGFYNFFATSYHKSINYVCTFGNYMYATADNMLKIIDLSSPASPVEAGAYTVINTFNDIAVYENCAYISADYSGMAVMDISDISKPSIISRYGYTGSNVRNVNILGHCLYMSFIDSNGLDKVKVLDVSISTSPAEIGEISASSVDTYNTGDTLYMLGNYNFQEINISSPTHARDRSFFSRDIYSAHCIAVNKHYAFIATGQDELDILDLSSNEYYIPFLGKYISDSRIYDIYALENYVYLATEKGMKILDVSNPQSPVVTGGYMPDNEVVYRIYISGKYAYLFGHDLSIIDISLFTPTEVGYYNTYVLNYCVSGNYIFITSGSDVCILKYTSPLITIEDGQAKIIGGANGWVEPDKGETVTIMLNPITSDKVKISIYTLSGQLVWTKDIEIESTRGVESDITWDCTNNSGEKIASGIYVAHIKGAGIDVKKKIAVIR